MDTREVNKIENNITKFKLNIPKMMEFQMTSINLMRFSSCEWWVLQLYTVTLRSIRMTCTLSNKRFSHCAPLSHSIVILCKQYNFESFVHSLWQASFSQFIACRIWNFSILAFSLSFETTLFFSRDHMEKCIFKWDSRWNFCRSQIEWIS